MAHEQYLNNAIMGLNTLVEGLGGSGKTFSTRIVVERLENMGKKVWVVGPTGKSAVQISSAAPGEYAIKARTIHSQFGIKPYNVDDLTELEIKRLIIRMSKSSRLNEYPDVIIIDEISMVGKVLLEIMNEIMQKVTGSTEVFGGVQVIVIGDMFQLQPVKDRMPYHSIVWKELNFHVVKYVENRRYEKEEDFELMKRIRLNELQEGDLDRLNIQYTKYLKRDFDNLPPLLSPQNRVVNSENSKRLASIVGTPFKFLADDRIEYHISGIGSEVSSRGHANPADRRAFESAKRSFQNEATKIMDEILGEEITLKVGCRVMFRKNIDPNRKIMNGTMGTVRAIGNSTENGTIIMDAKLGIDPRGDNLMVEIKPDTCSSTIIVTKGPWEQKTKFYTSIRCQIPVCLGYAMTIHKAQGSTLDSAIIDMSKKFREAQFYVAVSRVRTVENTYFTKRVRSTHIMENADAVKYFL